jgi:hypothetical protein
MSALTRALMALMVCVGTVTAQAGTTRQYRSDPPSGMGTPAPGPTDPGAPES